MTNAAADLRSAIDRLDIAAIDAALADGADINAPFPNSASGTLPVVAAVEVLWDRKETKFDPWPTQAEGEKEFRANVAAVVRHLLNRGADIETRFVDDHNALEAAVFANDPLLVETLLAAGADPNVRTPNELLLDEAITDFHYAMTRFIVAEDATAADHATFDTFLAFLERKNAARGGDFPPTVLRLLRKFGARSVYDETPGA